MKFDLVIADPAGNITVFVLKPPAPAAERILLSKALLADPALSAEQVAFVIPPNSAGEQRRYWRLEMMGGEFCGNAARSFGLLVAQKTGLLGRRRVMIESSGADSPLPVQVDTETGRAEAEIPGPRSINTLEFEGRILPVCVFDGITHVIAEDLEPARETFFAIKALYENAPARNAAPRSDAFGVMFYNRTSGFMSPLVYVYGTDSLVFESSCGSGSAALASYKSRELGDGEKRYEIRQPGGVIETRVVKQGGEVISAAIGGPVEMRQLAWTGGGYG
jgi:diaminopimelate epimerase